MQANTNTNKANSLPLYLITKFVMEDHEWGMSRSGHSESYVPHVLSNVQADYEREFHRRGVEGPVELITYSTLADVMEAIYNAFDDIVGVYTKAEIEEEERAKERRACESYVASLCARRGIRGSDTHAVLDALSDEIQRAYDRNYGLMEDGLCATTYGLSSPSAAYDEWCDMHESNYSDAERADRAIDWIADNCPLCFAQWEESRRKEEE